MPRTLPAPPGSSQTAARVCEETARLCAERYRGRLRAVVVTGSLARDEATFIDESRVLRLLGDGEFLLIFDDISELPAESEVRQLGRHVEESLRTTAGLTAQIGLSAGRARYLTSLDPHIFAFELRERGRVLWGDLGILSLIPAFTVSEIPLEDGWRLLANRMVEQLEVISDAPAGRVGGSRDARYRSLKLYLDMATSFLLFAGAYAPTYRERAANLAALAECADPGTTWPFPLPAFADRVGQCTRLKLGEGDGPTAAARLDEQLGLLDWCEAVSDARRLWRWELARLGAGDAELGDQALMTRWMSAQPLPARLRGWLYVARRTGWWRSRSHWPGWIRRGWRASPRYWVYASAAELVFRLPELLGSSADSLSRPVLEELAAALPVSGSRTGGTRTTWQDLAVDITWNYKQFLTDTRA